MTDAQSTRAEGKAKAQAAGKASPKARLGKGTAAASSGVGQHGAHRAAKAGLQSMLSPNPKDSAKVPPESDRTTGSSTRSTRSTPSDKSMNKGLRQISIRLCEKVKEKGRTTYSEVADELAEEFSAGSPEKAKVTTDSNFSSPGAEKNIRRRVYDALNVLFSAGVIQKEKKHIMWRGLPEQLEVQSLEKDKRDIKRRIEEKRQMMREQQDKLRRFEMLVARNRRKQNELNAGGDDDKPAKRFKAECTIQLPFIVVNTKATTQWRRWEQQAAEHATTNTAADAATSATDAAAMRGSDVQASSTASVSPLKAEQGAPGARGGEGDSASDVQTAAEGSGLQQCVVYDFTDEFQLQDDNEVLHKMAGSGLLEAAGLAAAAKMTTHQASLEALSPSPQASSVVSVSSIKEEPGLPGSHDGEGSEHNSA